MSQNTQPKGATKGVVCGIAYRPTDGDPMIVTDEGRVGTNGCLQGETRKRGPRAVTLISQEAWSDVCGELDVELPWQTRRANLLVRGIDLPATIGKRVRLGQACLLIHGESKPCNIMEGLHKGLRAALKPHARGGVFGEVLEGGIIRVGDVVRIA